MSVGSMQYGLLWLISAEPACYQASPTNSSSPLTNVDDDVSQYEGWACDGCGGTDIGHYNIQRLELFDKMDPEKYNYGVTNGHVGYLTMYQQVDGTYDLVSTTKVGGAFTNWGKCIREPPNADDFACTAVIAAASGKHVLTCVSLFASLK